MLNRILSDDKRSKYVNILFYMALTIELVLMIVEKSEISFSYESYVFRVTFLISLVAALLIKRDTKEWIMTLALLGFTFVCYHLSGKNDLLRIVTFILAARDIDLKKVMKYTLFVSGAGFLVIALLALFGIGGDVFLIADYGRELEEEKRLVLGFGHPNTLLGCVFALTLMWLWIYGEAGKLLHYVLVIFVSVITTYFTRSRTGLLVLLLTLIFAAFVRLFPKARQNKVLYVAGFMITPVLCTGLAIAAAWAAQFMYSGVDRTKYWRFWKLEELLNYRISNLYYAVDDHGGILSSWRLFARSGADGYFDMGWVRLFYWYGIIPTALILIAIAFMIYVCCQRRDAWTLLIILSLSVYTIVEATFVSRYIGRAFFLPIAGVYLGELIKGKTDD